MHTSRLTLAIINSLESDGKIENQSVGCSESGYDNKPQLLANWNNITDETYKYLESHGFSCEWEDEWYICDSCYKGFRCSPDSYGWEMYGAIVEECTSLCGNCLGKEINEYLESIENSPRKALTCALYYKYNPEKYGYKLIKDNYENGFYPGQNDNPKDILTKLLESNPNGKYIFVINDQGQFDIGFSVYQRIKE